MYVYVHVCIEMHVYVYVYVHVDQYFNCFGLFFSLKRNKGLFCSPITLTYLSHIIGLYCPLILKLAYFVL